MSDKEWYKELAAGDQVILKRSGFNPLHTVATVRLTPTQIVATPTTGAGQYRFAKANGREIGGDTWAHTWMLPYTEAEAATIRLKHWNRKLYQWCQDAKPTSFDALDLEQCTDLWRVLVTLGLAKSSM